MSASIPSCDLGAASNGRRLGASRVYEPLLVGPRGSEDVRVVPIRGSSLFKEVKEDFCSFNGSGRSEWAAWEGDGLWMGASGGGEVAVPCMKALLFSLSGGGVGGNMLRLTGGADC